MTEKHVLRHTEMRHLLQFLMDHGDPGQAGAFRLAEVMSHPIHLHFTLGRPEDTGEDAQQG